MMKTGLPSIADENSAVLILGTFPGEESLAAQQYYAHPRNLFWDVMDDMCGAGRHHPYEKRCRILRAHRIAVWDVLYSCEREGSADSRIQNPVVNDFAAFFMSHSCRTIFFNGKTAFNLFTRHVDSSSLELDNLIILPSTSPAYAGITREEKRRQWKKAAECLRSYNIPMSM